MLVTPIIQHFRNHCLASSYPAELSYIFTSAPPSPPPPPHTPLGGCTDIRPPDIRPPDIRPSGITQAGSSDGASPLA